MRVAVGQFRTPDQADLMFAAQIGASGVTFNSLDFDDAIMTRRPLGLPARVQGDLRSSWSYEDLARLREWVEAAGLKLEALENLPPRMMYQIKSGGPEAQAQIEHMCQTIENMGRAGIPVLGYSFMILPVLRTTFSNRLRGGAAGSAFRRADVVADHYRAFSPVSADEVWDRFATMMRQVGPVAASAKVKLALHPDDPPLDNVLGIARIFGNTAGLKRALDFYDSPYNALDLCIGSLAEGGAAEVYRALDAFLPDRRIAYIHMRNVSGAADSFHETFVDDGDVDMVRVVRALAQANFDGFIIDDHVPKMNGDTGWSHRGRAFATGYIKGLVASALVAL